ncbi:MAG: DUF2012 domain-containing protein [Balneolaceae bacterium]|nr:MAG: DUF2012 domain-containing protein [Balneolaceae bacterium]
MYQKVIMMITALAISSIVLMAATISPTGGDINIETSTISGTVLDAELEEGISGAEVTLEETDVTTTTDEYGTFTFTEVEEGSYTVVVEAYGFESAKVEVEVNEEGAAIEVVLEPEIK